MWKNETGLTEQHWQFLAAVYALLQEQPNPYNRVDAPSAARRIGIELDGNTREPNLKAARLLVKLVSDLAEMGLLTGSIPLSYQIRITHQGINELQKRRC